MNAEVREIIRREITPIEQPTAKRRKRPVIGRRWAPGPVERRDTAAGTFEAVNGAPGPNMLRVQRALLGESDAPATVTLAERIVYAAALGLCCAGLVAMYFWGRA